LGELAERSSLSRSGITRLIDRMVEGGVISREACEHDGRGTYAVISELGKTKLTAALQVQERVLKAAFYQRFTSGDMEAFVRIAGALEAAD
ncbi:MAG: MarR family winged helix-turn-helix transcriptional regulator, partial [Armatimonadota bacterium]